MYGSQSENQKKEQAGKTQEKQTKGNGFKGEKIERGEKIQFHKVIERDGNSNKQENTANQKEHKRTKQNKTIKGPCSSFIKAVRKNAIKFMP